MPGYHPDPPGGGIATAPAALGRIWAALHARTHPLRARASNTERYPRPVPFTEINRGLGVSSSLQRRVFSLVRLAYVSTISTLRKGCILHGKYQRRATRLFVIG